MERRTLAFIVCSPLPRIGKTLVARMAVEFFHADGRRVAAFDVNPEDCVLARQLPDITTVANVSDTKGQMLLFDLLIVADGTTKVIDVGDRSFEQFFMVMENIGFEAAARYHAIVPVVLLIVDADRRSIQAHAALQARFPGLALVPVFNAGTADTRFRSESGAKFREPPLHVPLLSPAARSLAAQFGYSPGIGGGRSAETANELQTWKRRVFLQLREMELRLLLAEIKPALQLRA